VVFTGATGVVTAGFADVVAGAEEVAGSPAVPQAETRSNSEQIQANADHRAFRSISRPSFWN
jgi:hypothetical protein